MDGQNMNNILSSSDFGAWKLSLHRGVSAGGVGQVVIDSNASTPTGINFQPFATTAAILVGIGTNQESVTPTVVDYQTIPRRCIITATFANAHGEGDVVQSGTQGIQEAINYAAIQGTGQINFTMTERLTLSTSAATTDTSAKLIPANSMILSVAARVVVAIATATDWALGDASTSDRFVAANATLAAGTTSITPNPLFKNLAAGGQAAAAALRVTTTGSQTTAGVIQITTKGILFTA